MDSVTVAEIAKLDTMTVSKLVEKFESLVGEKCRSRNKRYLIRRIAWRLQANAEGGLSERALKRAAELALDSEVRVTPPREHKRSRVVVATVESKPVREGLELEFNSLHAQRESAEAFIASQQHEGWECLPDRYDDGGFSGGSLERPALNRLLEDIKTGRIDCVVVYKVDRLSRSLLDFSRIMETFDKHGVSFVSVTQQFNTTHSMGRLTLNILLSFAQFEREIIGERIRDKIAAQRRKGKWAGGVPILGYDVDRSNASPKLVINAEEAVMVRRIFSLYQELGSLLPVVNEVNKRGWQNKVWKTKKGLTRGGKAFDKCSIYSLLTNPLYAGLIRHKDLLHKGEHENLIAPEVFEAVQKQLKQNGRGQGNHLINKHGALLKGLLHCSACDRAMVHTFTQKDEKLYRYYTCTNVIKNGRGKCPSPHLPAGEIEKAVIEQIRAIGADFEIQNQVVAQMKEGQTKRLEELQTNRRQLERQPRMTQILNLNLLSPAIQEQLLHLPPHSTGRQAIHEKKLRTVCSITDWSDQQLEFARHRKTNE